MLFDIESSEGVKSDKKDSETSLTLLIKKKQILKRANTFLKKYSDIVNFENWFIENFFPFFMENEYLNLSIEINGQKSEISKSYIEDNIESIPFGVKLGNELGDDPVDFKLWLVKKEESKRTKNLVTCFARHLQAELECGKIEYEIDLPNAYDWFLTSIYFDDNVDQKGDKIEISDEQVEKIQLALISALDKHFAKQIEKNRTETKKNIQKTEDQYPSLSIFIENRIESTRKIVKVNEGHL